MILGGATFSGPRYLWWDFVASSQERIEHAQAEWRAAIQRYRQALVAIDRVMGRFRTSFLGKSSPVHLFWGALDLAVTRFSGLRAPLHPAGIPSLPDDVAQDAYDREVSSAGVWPGSNGIDFPAFYAYAYPAPGGYRAATVRPNAAFWHDSLSEFILP